MTQKLYDAKEILEQNHYTCVVLKDEKRYTSKERGVKPLLAWIEDGVDLRDASASDKVVGKAAAYLYVKLQIKELYAGVISAPACAVLETYGIAVQYEQKVEAIRNRTNTGFCPMEMSVMNIDDPDTAVDAIKKRLLELESTV